MVTSSRVENAPSATTVGAKLSVPPPPRHKWPGPKPQQITEATKLVAGPIYDLAAVQQLIRTGAPFFVVNEEARLNLGSQGERPMRKPVWVESDIRGFILALSPSCYVNSQWCITSAKATLDCDAYAMTYNRTTQSESTIGTKIYIKFGYNPNTSPDSMLICSVHPADR